MKLAVLGAGGWGTAFSRLAANAGHETTLWVRDPAQAEAIVRVRENVKYLPGVTLPTAHLAITTQIADAAQADVIVLAVPSFAVAETCDRVRPHLRDRPVLVNLSKGLDRTTGRTMSAVVHSCVDGAVVFALSGPSHAEEVGRDMPTAVVLAGEDQALGRKLQRAIGTSRFRVYWSDDLRGVEICATVKNIIAIATGISDGLGYGDNSRGALITRGLAEMVRFGRSLGVHDSTYFGLSGLGDLVATCTSAHSRNRAVGYRLGRGERLEAILNGMVMVAEGVFATRIVRDMARTRGIEMPITEAVDRMLDGTADPLSLVDEIMMREPKAENR
jgi:glycerol-3-phosphate dehydrogenase (NAD(P)+)